MKEKIKIMSVNEETSTLVFVSLDRLPQNSKKKIEDVIKEFNQSLGIITLKGPMKFSENIELLQKAIHEARKKIIIQAAV